MHELSLAKGVIDILCEEAARHEVSRVQQVVLRIGVLRAVVPELLRTGMAYASEGTMAETCTAATSCPSTIPGGDGKFLPSVCSAHGISLSK